MERIWLNSYPPGVPAEIDADAFRSLGDFFAVSVDRFRGQVALYVRRERRIIQLKIQPIIPASFSSELLP